MRLRRGILLPEGATAETLAQYQDRWTYGVLAAALIHDLGKPAIDQTVMVPRLEPGEVIRASATRQDPGGKAVNVASCLADWGVKVVVTGLLGRDNAASFEQLFAFTGGGNMSGFGQQVAHWLGLI